MKKKNEKKRFIIRALDREKDLQDVNHNKTLITTKQSYKII